MSILYLVSMLGRLKHRLEDEVFIIIIIGITIGKTFRSQIKTLQ